MTLQNTSKVVISSILLKQIEKRSEIEGFDSLSDFILHTLLDCLRDSIGAEDYAEILAEINSLRRD